MQFPHASVARVLLGVVAGFIVGIVMIQNSSHIPFRGQVGGPATVSACVGKIGDELNRCCNDCMTTCGTTKTAAECATQCGCPAPSSNFCCNSDNRCVPTGGGGAGNCGTQAVSACNLGTCPAGQRCQVNGTACSCVAIECANATAPACGGTCGPGMACALKAGSNPQICECIAAPKSCGDSAPACDGTCPPGEACQRQADGTCFCGPNFPL